MVTVALGAVLVCGSISHARSLADVLESPQFAALGLGPLGAALADTVAGTYPVASASSSVTYIYDPALESFERASEVAGPIIGERAETIGKGQFNFGFSYSYVELTQINGDDLDDLVNQPVVDGQVISFPVPGGVTLKDGRSTTFLPVRVGLDLGVDAHIFTPSATYGVLPNWDVSMAIPLVYTSLDVTTESLAPDPRLPQFMLPANVPSTSRRLSDSESTFGIGDILLRTKYVAWRGKPADVAAMVGLSIPTGDEDDFHGTGDTRVRPMLIVSRVFASRFEPLLNVGLDFVVDDVDRSAFQWAVGGMVQIVDPLTAAIVFLGRNEFARQADAIETPFFFQIERNDIYDASVGLRYQFAEAGTVSLNAIVPMNDDGLRPDVVPTFQIEYAF